MIIDSFSSVLCSSRKPGLSLMRLQPGDQLWNRFQVERAECGPFGGAALVALHAAPSAADNPERHLLIPLSSSARHPLSELLAAAGQALALSAPAAPMASAAKSKAKRRAAAGALQPLGGELPFVGAVEWIGDAASGGVAVLADWPGKSLAEVVSKNALTPAQVVPMFHDLAQSLARLMDIFQEPLARDAQARAKIAAAVARMLNPGALAVRADDGFLRLRPALPSAAAVLTPPPWSDFIAPEVYGESGASSASLVFGIGKLLAYCLGAGPNTSAAAPLSPEAEWAALAGWVSGKRDAAREFSAHPAAAALPAELSDIIERCLARKISKRPADAQKLLQELEDLGDLEWVADAAHCSVCGFVLPPAAGQPVLSCPCCDTENPRSDSKPSGKTAVSALLPRSINNAKTGGLPDGMTLIPAGMFLSGERKVPRALRAFAIDTIPVTEGVYKEFLKKTGKMPRKGGPGTLPASQNLLPVTGLTWYEANEFAEHHDKRLPTIYEWEKAARGVDGRKFPFGNTYKPNCGQLRASGDVSAVAEPAPATVGSFVDGASPYGVLDMAGNVLEWTCSARRAGDRLFRAVKGACFHDGSTELARCASVQYLPPENGEPHIGFRCVKDLEAE
jgi:serine/threonine-protein kinase